MPVSTAVVRVTPTSRDAVVAAVRRGLRTALSVARRRAGPRPSSRPASLISAGTTTGPSTSTPVNVVAHPSTTTSVSSTATAAPSRAIPAASTTTPNARRRRPAWVRVSTVASGRSAVSGLTRTVRRVGSQAATRVTDTPTASPAAYQSGETAASPSRDSGQRSVTRATTPWPSAVPTSSATTEAPTPIPNASRRIERSTWRRVAPTHLSSAKSRWRCANRIEKVLAITSTDTNSAIAANSSSMIASTSISSLASIWASSTCSSLVRTVASGAIARIWSACSSVDPVPAQATLSTYMPSAQVARSSQVTYVDA